MFNKVWRWCRILREGTLLAHSSCRKHIQALSLVYLNSVSLCGWQRFLKMSIIEDKHSCPNIIYPIDMFVNHWGTLLNNFNNLFNLNMACMSAVWLTGPYKWATLPNSGLVTNPLNPELVRDCEGTLEIWRESDPAPLMRVITTAIALLLGVCVIRRLQLHFIWGRTNEDESWRACWNIQQMHA